MDEMVKLCLPLSDAKLGSSDDHAALLLLEDRLADAVETAGVGDCDGNQIGKGLYEVFFYGPSADALLEVIRPILAQNTIPAGSSLVARRGSDETEERIDL